MGDVRVPTLIGQGQADTLFNLQESVATYTALRQGTGSLVWQSWGTALSPAATGHAAPRILRGRRRWPGSTTTSRPARARRLPLLPRLGVRAPDITGLRHRADYPVGTERLPLGAAPPARALVTPPVPSYAKGAVGPNYSETSGRPERPVTDPPGTAIRSPPR